MLFFPPHKPLHMHQDVSIQGAGVPKAVFRYKPKKIVKYFSSESHT